MIWILRYKSKKICLINELSLITRHSLPLNAELLDCDKLIFLKSQMSQYSQDVIGQFKYLEESIMGSLKQNMNVIIPYSDFSLLLDLSDMFYKIQDSYSQIVVLSDN